MNHPTLKSLTLGIGLFFTLPLVYANSSFRLYPMEHCISINRKPVKWLP